MSRASLLPRLLGVLLGFALGLWFIGVQIIGWGVGERSFDVKVNVPRSAGLFEQGEVTYRGVKVGSVKGVELTQDGGVQLVLEVAKDQRIPAQSQARIRMLSALGENYVDLMPAADLPASAPVLRAGSVISDTTLPTPVGQALASSSRMLESIDPQDIATLTTVLDEGFTGLAPELRTLVVSGQALLKALVDAAPGTRAVILDGLDVLRAGNASREDLATVVKSFNAVSASFADKDADFALLLRDGGQAATAFEELVRTQTQPFQELLQGSSRIGQAFSANESSAKALFALLPKVSTNLSEVARDGALHGQLSMNFGQPLCSTGALPLPARGSAATQKPCSSAPGLLQRGPQ